MDTVAAQRRRTWKLRLGVAGVALTLAACGTTVPDGQFVAIEAGVAPDGTTQVVVGGPGLDETSPDTTQATGSSADPGGPAITVAAASDSPTTQPTAQPGSPAPTGPARGVTDSVIKIGVTAPSDEGSLAGSLGVAGGSSVSVQAMTNAVLADINSSGGIVGRKVEVLVHEYDVNAALADPARAFGAVCSDFRDDRPVFAIISSTSTNDLVRCSADMGSPLFLAGAGQILPASDYAIGGGSYLYAPNAITSNRMADLFVQSLIGRSFFEKWNISSGKVGNQPVELGLIHADTPGANAMYASYADELAKNGLSFAETVTYGGEIQAAISATQSAILKFRSAGVTHVFGASAFFLRFADAQGYKPRYAYLPGLGQIGVENSPASQLNGAMTVGWSPISDVPIAHAPAESTGAQKCRSVMEAAGLATTERADRAAMYATCDSLYAMRDALAASGQVSVAGLRTGYESLGTGFSPALTFPTTFGPNKHSGIDSVRDMGYFKSCACFQYTASDNRT